MEQLEIRKESELSIAAHTALRRLAEQTPHSAAAVLGLSGNLGAGKTAFTKALAFALGVQEDVTSPTFVILKSYACTQGPYEKLVHIDAYRIEDIDEMRPLRFQELLSDAGTLICIEWAEHIQALLPAHTVFLRLEIKDADVRSITIS